MLHKMYIEWLLCCLNEKEMVSSAGEGKLKRNNIPQVEMALSAFYYSMATNEFLRTDDEEGGWVKDAIVLYDS